MRTPCKNIDSGKITQNYQEEPAMMRSQCEGHGHAICATTFDTLNDDILLEIFDFIRSSFNHQVRFPLFWDPRLPPPVWKWHPLVRVCRRWRQVIFASPLRLDLQLLCTHGTPVRKNLGCWPPTLPIVIGHGHNSMKDLLPEDEDNVFAALEQRDRVRHINLWVTYAALENMVTLMQEPFPELRRLAISPRSQNMPILPDDFLGGSAPYLREISFCGIPFPALPTLVSSASDLVQLILVDIPQTGHISSAAFAASLAILPSLEHLSIEFRSPGSPTDQTHLPPKTRAILPSLTSFIFEGESAYFEVFLAQLDTPQLDWINIGYTDDLDFRVTEFPKFIERSVLKPSRFGHAEIFFGGHVIWFYFFHQTDLPTIAIRFLLDDHTSGLIFDMARLLNQTSAMLSEVVRLEIRIDSSSPYWRDDIGGGLSDGTEWLELFRPFKAVEKLDICEELAECITHALEGRTEAVLPALKSIFVEDQQARDMRELADRRERGRLLSNGDEGLQ